MECSGYVHNRNTAVRDESAYPLKAINRESIIYRMYYNILLGQDTASRPYYLKIRLRAVVLTPKRS